MAIFVGPGKASLGDLNSFLYVLWILYTINLVTSQNIQRKIPFKWFSLLMLMKLQFALAIFEEFYVLVLKI